MVAIPVHLISEPLHFLQLTSIIVVLHLTVNRAGYRSPIHMPHTFNSGGLGALAVMAVFR
mgnify:CR=1 FL=1